MDCIVSMVLLKAKDKTHKNTVSPVLHSDILWRFLCDIASHTVEIERNLTYIVKMWRRLAKMFMFQRYLHDTSDICDQLETKSFLGLVLAATSKKYGIVNVINSIQSIYLVFI